MGAAKAITALVVLLLFTTAAAANDDVEFIRSSCSSTTYPDLCFDTLSTHASLIKRNPVMLATTALSVSLDAARRASANMDTMMTREKLKAREAAAVKDCIDTLTDSAEQIRRAIGEMGYLRKRDRNLGFHISNVQTWVSAALTDDRTCIEGFSEAAMNSPVKVVVRNRVVSVAHRTSNALALISALVSSSP